LPVGCWTLEPKRNKTPPQLEHYRPSRNR
jgi:hypothetical protein